MLKSKQVSQTASYTIQKCKANEGTSRTDVNSAEKWRVKHSQGIFHPTAIWSHGLTSPVLWSPPTTSIQTRLNGLNRMTPTHHFALLPEKFLHTLTADRLVPGSVLLSGQVSLPAKNRTADLQRGRDYGIFLGLTQTTWLGPSTPDRARSCQGQGLAWAWKAGLQGTGSGLFSASPTANKTSPDSKSMFNMPESNLTFAF